MTVMLKRSLWPVFIVIAALLLSVALVAVACGGEEEGRPATGKTPAPASATKAQAAGPVTIQVSMGDNFFDPKDIEVSAGQKVTINMTNTGQNIHNLRIAGPDGKYNTGDDAVSKPDTVQAGAKATLTWQAPTKAGEINFRCDFHAQDMTGTITLK